MYLNDRFSENNIFSCFQILAVSNAYKTIQDPEKLQRVKEILDEANALVIEKVCTVGRILVRCIL
jgi:hypothetical protein